MPIVQNRRRVLAGLTAIGAAGVAGCRHSSAAETPPETATVRFAKTPGICIAPQYVAEELLHAEGFNDVRYMKADAGVAQTEMLARGDLDFSIQFATAFVIPIDAGTPVKVLSGVHVGCYELFAHEGIRSIVDLKGRTVGVGPGLSSAQVFVSAMATFVGLDPARDIDWVTAEFGPAQLFIEGKVDAFLAFPPVAQELRTRNIGHVVVNSIMDRPWSQYFCCMLASSAAYVENHPVATKRVIRAILKAADTCVAEPQRVARLLVDGGYTEQYDYAVQALQEIPYARWMDYDPEDTIRFFALRLHEAGIIKSGPQKIIANGTDWRLLNELKRELKT
jgi:NitT/TauT family transport system substrate-binding protein